MTLFLGLTTTGSWPVDVKAPPGTAAVSYLVDGELAAKVWGPPWATSVDFGPRLLPHELVAVATDAEERELARAVQLVNLPRPLAEAVFVLEEVGAGRWHARLRWQSAVARSPRSVRLTLGGEPLEVPDPLSFAVPPAEGPFARVLRAELQFEGGVAATAEALVGGRDRDASATALTAVPVVFASTRREPTPDSLAGALLAKGQPLRVVAVEEPAADVVFVVDPAAEGDLLSIDASRLQRRALAPSLRMGRDVSRYFVMPVPAFHPDTGFQVFPLIGPFEGGSGRGLIADYSAARRRHPNVKESLLPGAAQISGVFAVQNGRRRAVVWVLSAAEPSDEPLAAARDFLRALNVPLAVWCVAQEASREGARSAPQTIVTSWDVESAIGVLEDALERQRIVWVEGRHLPQTIEVAPGRTGIAIAR